MISDEFFMVQTENREANFSIIFLVPVQDRSLPKETKQNLENGRVPLDLLLKSLNSVQEKIILWEF